MKYTFETEEEQEALLTLYAPKIVLALWHYSQWLRSKHKHSDDPMVHAYDARQKLFECIEEQGIPDIMEL